MGGRDQDRGHQGRVRSYHAGWSGRLAPRLALVLNPRLPPCAGASLFKWQGALQHWTNHDLGRSVRSQLSRLKIPEEVREAVLAHARPGIRKVYDLHDYLDEKREALRLWTARLRSIVTPPPDQRGEIACLTCRVIVHRASAKNSGCATGYATNLRVSSLRQLMKQIPGA